LLRKNLNETLTGTPNGADAAKSGAPAGSVNKLSNARRAGQRRPRPAGDDGVFIGNLSMAEMTSPPDHWSETSTNTNP
jgi:hypothetical protein